MERIHSGIEWASSRTTDRKGPMVDDPRTLATGEVAWLARRAWLVTTTSALPAAVRAAAPKHSENRGHFVHRQVVRLGRSSAATFSLAPVRSPSSEEASHLEAALDSPPRSAFRLQT